MERYTKEQGVIILKNLLQNKYCPLIGTRHISIYDIPSRNIDTILQGFRDITELVV